MLFAFALAVGVPPAEPLQEEMLSRIAGGDEDAFLEVYRQARGSVFAFAYSLLRNPQEAEDVTQDTFLKVRSAAHLYRPRGTPMAWILTITKNLCLMRLRRQKMIAPAPPAEDEADPGLDRIENALDRMAVQAAFRVLTEEECRVIVLHAVSGLKHRQIAQLMEIPLSTVLSRYSRALKKLRKELQA